MCVWEALGVSGRGTASASQRCERESLMIDDVGARLKGALGESCCCTKLISFNQDSETPLCSEQAGWFKPPERPRLA